MMEYRYDTSYREEATLKDGTRVLLRMIGPADKELLRKGFERLSPQSRYFRFFSSKPRLTDKELERLTEIDGINHFAIGAVLRNGQGEEEGLGTARFIRIDKEPEVAEPAVAVLDDYQGRGLGTLLLQRLVAAAHERGILRFRSSILADNVKMKNILGGMNPDILFMPADQGVIEVEFPLPETIRPETMAEDLRGSVAHSLLTHIAREVVSAHPGQSHLKHLLGKDVRDS
jgi:GNAT superfamily N-acetyltransferase